MRTISPPEEGGLGLQDAAAEAAGVDGHNGPSGPSGRSRGDGRGSGRRAPRTAESRGGWATAERWAQLGLTAVLLAMAAIAALIFGAGGLDVSGSTKAMMAGGVGVFATLAGLLPIRYHKRLNYHGYLIAGSLMFLLPFLWLVSTSFKDAREISAYPPVWVPSLPDQPLRSPHVSPKLLDPVQKPRSMPDENWESFRPRLYESIVRASVIHVSEPLVRGITHEDLLETLAPAVWNNVARSIPDEIWTRDEATIRGELLRRITHERVHAAWDQIYRCVALGVPLVEDQLQRSRPVSENTTEVLGLWRVVAGSAQLSRQQITVNPTSFNPALLDYAAGDDRGAVEIQAELPLVIPEPDLLAITVPMRQDATWQKLTTSLEFGGRRYTNEDPLFVGSYRWQELRLKLKERDAHDERKNGTWPLVRDSEAAGAHASTSTLLLTLRLEPLSLSAALTAKFTQNYRDAWYFGQYWPEYMFNSLYLVVLTVIGQILSCSLAAFAFARVRWPGRDVLFVVMISLMMLPPQVTMIPVFLIFRELGWYNTLKPLWVPAFFGTPFYIFMLRQFMKGIPSALDEAARIDGASYIGIYWRITLPLMRPALAATAIFTLMATYNDFLGPVIYVSDQRLYPLALGLFDLRNFYGNNFGMLMAASTIMVLPVVALFFAAQRYFITGVTLTGMKN